MSESDLDMVLLDIRLPGISGMQVLHEIQSSYPNVPVIVLTAINETYVAVEAMKSGASDYIVKPFSLDRVYTSIHTVLQAVRHSPLQKDAVTPHCAGKEESMQTSGEFSRQMDAIMCGVEARDMKC